MSHLSYQYFGAYVCYAHNYTVVGHRTSCIYKQKSTNEKAHSKTQMKQFDSICNDKVNKMSVYTSNYLEDKARRETVAEMMRVGDWRGVMDSFHGGEHARDPLLVWIRPSLQCLQFIKQQINSLGINSISSIGRDIKKGCESLYHHIKSYFK